MMIKVAIVDDKRLNRLNRAEELSYSKIITVAFTAQNGEEALLYFNTLKYNKAKTVKKPQLIFLDLNMPVMGGWEFLDYFTSPAYDEFNSVNVIVLSSTINPEDLLKAKKYPIIKDFLSKPITKAMLEYLKNKMDL